MSRLADRLQRDLNEGKVASIRAIARQANVSEGTIRGILNGTTPRRPTINKLADNYFKLPRAEIYRMTGEHLPNHRGNEPDRDWVLERIYDMMTRLPNEDLAEILSIVMYKVKEIPDS